MSNMNELNKKKRQVHEMLAQAPNNYNPPHMH